MTVGVKERILTIRLLDKVTANPAAVQKLGITVVNELRNARKQIDQNQAENAG